MPRKALGTVYDLPGLRGAAPQIIGEVICLKGVPPFEVEEPVRNA